MNSTITDASLLPATGDIKWERYRLAASDDASMPNATLVVDHFGGNKVVGTFDNEFSGAAALKDARISADALNQHYWLEEGITMMTAMQHDTSIRPSDGFESRYDSGWFNDGSDIYDWHGLRVTSLVSQLAAEYYIAAANHYFYDNFKSLKNGTLTVVVE